MRRDPQTTARANAEVLLWQGRVRIAVAMAAGGIAFVLREFGMLQGNAAALLAVIAGYLGAIGVLGWSLRRHGAAGDSTIAATVACDLLFIFASTLASASPDHYYRILILSFFVLHLTESYFGRRHAVFALGAVVGAYGGLLAAVAARGLTPRWPDELWALALFTITSVAFLVQYGSSQRRLERIVELFEDAEQGDFTNAYDLAADHAPDAITRVGRAYNRVRVQLASMVLTDPLTGCLNRRGLDQAMAREIARSARAGSELSLIAFDLDHFKHINDSYGHLAGDVVLRDFGALLVQIARAGDMVARTGGEEFSILLPDTDPAGAYRAGVRVCDSVRSHHFLVNGKRVQVTISVGVVSVSGAAHDAAGTSLKARADEALYAAKRGGRDRVRVWNDGLASLESETPPDGAVIAPSDGLHSALNAS
ncbi:MAG TPA: GGDEF domain-containing protein [Gemmatimonadaceae bacterium]|nr:GGDEF domain-containing protein [Gemmatimonadaceae bacterium]